MAENELPQEVRDRIATAATDARAQASENGFGFMRSEFRRAKPDAKHPEGEIFEIPHRDLFDNDQQERWDELQAEIRTYDREPDLRNDKGDVVVRGQLVIPHHNNGQLVKPPWPERLAVVLWGKDGAVRAKKGGILFNEIEVVWGKQAEEYRKRALSDSKSGAGGAAVESAPDTD